MFLLARIALINPAPETIEEFKIESRQKSWPPLGLLYNGEILRQSGHEVKILDPDVTGYSSLEVLNWIKKFDPEILGLYPLTVSLDSALEIAQLTKKWNDTIITVFGNILATLAYNQLLRNYDYLDYCLRARAAKYRIVFVPSSLVWHKVSATTGGKGSLLNTYYSSRNIPLALRKNGIFFRVHFWNLLKFIKNIFELAFIPKRRDKAKAVIRGLKDFYSGKFGKQYSKEQ